MGHFEIIFCAAFLPYRRDLLALDKLDAMGPTIKPALWVHL